MPRLSRVWGAGIYIDWCIRSLIVPSSLLQVVNSLFQQFGTSSANTTCQQLANRLVSTCLQAFYSLCVFERVFLKPVIHLATLFARREAKTRIRQRDWLKLAGEKIRREQVGSVPTFLSVRANKFAKWKIGFRLSLP